jgi:hypothetical protein
MLHCVRTEPTGGERGILGVEGAILSFPYACTRWERCFGRRGGGTILPFSYEWRELNLLFNIL